MKFYTIELGHMTNIATVPIYGKNIDIETWYVALSMQVLPRLFKL